MMKRMTRAQQKKLKPLTLIPTLSPTLLQQRQKEIKWVEVVQLASVRQTSPWNTQLNTCVYLHRHSVRILLMVFPKRGLTFGRK
jgi:hypothetical protein